MSLSGKTLLLNNGYNNSGVTKAAKEGASFNGRQINRNEKY